VELGLLGTSASEWPIEPAAGDCYDGEFDGIKIGRGNRSTRRKPTPALLCPPQIPLVRPGLPRWEASDYTLELWRGLFTVESKIRLIHSVALTFPLLHIHTIMYIYIIDKQGLHNFLVCAVNLMTTLLFVLLKWQLHEHKQSGNEYRW
jgi:hypothetical protein